MFALLITAAAAQGMSVNADLMPRHLDADGVKAVYTRSVDADGTVHLRGSYRDHGRTLFHYKVKDGKVDATIAGVPYRFEAPTKR